MRLEKKNSIKKPKKIWVQIVKKDWVETVLIFKTHNV